MNKNFYIQEKTFTIYALHIFDDEDFIFVGKTSSPRVSAVYSEHIRGRRESTSFVISKENRPDLHVLDVIHTTENIAYKHMLAWTAFFAENGYEMLNGTGMIAQTETLHEETAVILERIRRETAEEVLNRTYVQSPKDADIKTDASASTLASEQEKTVQMNIRLLASDKKRFDVFRSRTGLNQREAFSLLLDQTHTDDKITGLKSLLDERDEKIAQLNSEIEKLKEKLKEERRKPRPEDYVRFIRTGVNSYLRVIFPSVDEMKKLHSGNYKKFKRIFRDAEYKYPDYEGFMVLRPEALLWGNSRHKTVFLVGIGADGKRYKLRYYPQKYYIGLTPQDLTEKTYFVGFTRAKDGAMEICAAMPLLDEKPSKKEESKETKPKQSLDEMIGYAERRKN